MIKVKGSLVDMTSARKICIRQSIHYLIIRFIFIPEKCSQTEKNQECKVKNKGSLGDFFFDHQGIVHYKFLPQGQTINQHVYLAILHRLRESIRKKRPEKWISGEWMLHHDNAPAHRALSVGDFLTKNSMLTMPHPPYSPDLAPNNFFLFPRMKSVLKGHRFDTVNFIKEKIR
ncbi:hypothetical protein LAZ67_1002091 [Cordylochernes scorpioides]|uniref:Mariner Mos1 transposase n=1 Tax=Cordylochernes scorpioides TaxID=51811 RepID=A0ABY6JXK4_9ARAC|nr:hypothetical protein LAZ67_1002091 [Cordylochernes scorpioides]